MTFRRIWTCLVVCILLGTFHVAAADGNSWQCPACAKTCSASYSFCPYCGAARETVRTCAACGFQTTDGQYAYCPQCGAALTASVQTASSYVTGRTQQDLATRSGPSTSFTDMGVYRVKEEDVRIYSIAYDNNKVAWVQCEVSYGGMLRRVYTGFKRFDASTVDLSQVREEGDLADARIAIVDSGATLRDGPGALYSKSKQNMTSTQVAVICVENGWVQVQFIQDETPWRAWVQEKEIAYTSGG